MGFTHDWIIQIGRPVAATNQLAPYQSIDLMIKPPLLLVSICVIAALLCQLALGSVCIAHRGIPNRVMENSISGFKQAVSLGARRLETDLQMTLDGRLILMHDHTFDRTTNSTGVISDIPWKGIADRIWLKVKSDGADVLERVPLLEEFVQFVKDNSGRIDEIILDIKSENNQSIVRKAVEIVRSFGEDVFRKFTFGAWDPSFLKVALSTAGEQQSMMISEDLKTVDDTPIADRVRSLSVNEAAALKNVLWVMIRIREYGQRVYIWTINDPGEIDFAVGLGIFAGIITDELESCLKFEHGANFRIQK